MNKGLRRLMILLMVLVILLSVAVTGFGSPAFILKLMRKEKPELSYAQEEPSIPAPVPAIQGHSAPVALAPSQGFTLEAPENTFKEDTQIRAEELQTEELAALADKMNLEAPGLFAGIYDAWQVDAGLTSDELAPGAFTMTWNLREMGYPEEIWQELSLFRLDENGSLTDYATTLKDGILTARSRQNSIYFLAKYLDWTLPVLDSGGTKRFVIQYDIDESLQSIREMREQLRRASRESLLKLLDAQSETDPKAIQKCRRIIADSQGKSETAIKSRDIVLWQQQKMEEFEKADPNYERLRQMEEDWQNGFWGKLAEVVRKQALKAYEYDKAQGGPDFKLPTHVVYINMDGEKAGGATQNAYRVAGNSHIILGTSEAGNGPQVFEDTVLLTLVHEFLHVCQREYKNYWLQNVKYDEAMAQMLETKARAYFKRTGEIQTACPGTSYNLNKLQYYALPLDDYSVTNPVWDLIYGGSYSAEGSEKSDSGYPLAYFLNHLVNRYRPNANFHDLCSAYDAFAAKPDLVELLKSNFYLSDEMFDTQWHLFAGSMAGKFRRWQTHKLETEYQNSSFATARHTVKADKPVTVALTDQNYTIRIRSFAAIPPQGYTGNMALLFTQEKGFTESLPDLCLFPFGEKWTFGPCKHGMLSSGIPANVISCPIMESDAGSGTGGSASYQVYLLTTPQMDKPEVVKGTLQFKLPDRSAAAQAGLIDGYRIRITCSDGTETDWHYRISGAGKEIAIKLSKLMRTKPQDMDEEEPSFTVSATEYMKELDGSYTYGPESDLISSMEATLAEEGAMEGPITISLGWQTTDDLDLHVTTPDGSEICYSTPYGQGGMLDVDMQINGDDTDPAEHIVFQEPASGVYRVAVHTFTDRTEDSDTPFVVVVKIGEDYRKVYRLTATGYRSVCAFEYNAATEKGQEYLEPEN